MKMNHTMKLAGILLLGVFLASACTQTYSQTPLGTPTLIPTGLFVSPFPSGQDPLAIIASLGTQTADAQTAVAGGTVVSGTPGTPATQAAVTVAIGTPGSPTATLGTSLTQSSTTLLPVTVIPGGSTFTPTTQSTGATLVVPTLAGSTSVPVGSVPASYTLQKGEWPYCVARRYNLNPDQLLSVNGLSAAQSTMLNPGLVLKLPQTGDPFPSARAWHTHPDTYTVDPGDTIYSVACYYGDLTPDQIASSNSISVSSTLTSGQKLTIP